MVEIAIEEFVVVFEHWVEHILVVNLGAEAAHVDHSVRVPDDVLEVLVVDDLVVPLILFDDDVNGDVVNYEFGEVLEAVRGDVGGIEVSNKPVEESGIFGLQSFAVIDKIFIVETHLCLLLEDTIDLGT